MSSSATVAAGSKVPHATLFFMDPPIEGACSNSVNKKTTEELFGQGKTVLFAVPGAYTPTCSAQHLPGYVSHFADFKAKGVDRIACIATNDAFVMDNWGRVNGADGKVMMLADGNGELAAALGLEMDGSGFGLGKRMQRFAAILQDGVIQKLFVEQPRKFEVSAAEYVLSQL